MRRITKKGIRRKTRPMKILKAYNVQIWCGLRHNYTDQVHPIEEVRMTVDRYIFACGGDCVTITETEYRYKGGSEPGVIIGWIQYPRFPRKRKKIRKDALYLAGMLMFNLGQNRVTVTTPYKSYMISADE